MSAIYPPTETRLKNLDGTIEKGLGECIALSADEDVGAFVVGGYGFEKGKVTNLRSLWRKQEKDSMKDFMRLYRKWRAELIPILREDYKAALLKRFNTTNPKEHERNINKSMMDNPRLDILTKKGVIKTSVLQQDQYMACYTPNEGVKR